MRFILRQPQQAGGIENIKSRINPIWHPTTPVIGFKSQETFESAHTRKNYIFKEKCL